MPAWFSVGTMFLLGLALSGWATLTASGSEPMREEAWTVVIEARQFQPNRTILHRGRRTILMFKNRDAELHTVTPLGLFARTNPAVSGNGAIEFEGEEFKRVIIPPDGTAEFHFTPTDFGEYRYVCDMPGHEMKGLIVVE